MAVTCAICSEPEADEALLSACFQCGRRYHLNPYSNRPGKDCGDAILGDSLGVEYYCAPCLRELEGGEPAVVAPPPATAPASPRRRRYRRIDA